MAAMITAIRNLDIRWVAGVLGTLTLIEMGVVNGQLPLDGAIPAAWAPHVIAWCRIFVYINNALLVAHAGSALTWPTTTPKAAVLFALAIGAALFATASPTFAQTKEKTVYCTDLLNKLPPGCTPRTTETNNGLDQLWQKLQQASIADLQYAKALSDASGTAGGKMRSACWGAWITLVQTQQGVNAVGADGKPLGAKPDPSLFTNFEQLAEVVDSLQPTSPFMVACQPVANTIKQSVLNLVTMVVSGQVTLGALGVAIP